MTRDYLETKPHRLSHVEPCTLLTYALDWIEALIEAGWSVGWHSTLRVYEWRTKEGLSGSDYHTRRLNEFPPSVMAWIRQQPAKS